MSRVGRMPITVPSGVTIVIDDGQVNVNGPKGSLQTPLLPGISLAQEGETVILSRQSDEKTQRAQHGLMRALVSNMTEGVSKGFEKKLELHGVGFRVNQSGSDLKFNLGFSHEVVYNIPAGVNVVIDQNIITISGPDKQQVGQVAAEVRALRKPEPYKGKGIRYEGERILRKSGKSGKEAA